MEYEFIEHTADIKFKAYGKTEAEVFENSALALSHYLSSGKRIKPEKGKVISASGSDFNSLLYNFLEEIIILSESGFVLSKISVQLYSFTIKAEIFGSFLKSREITQVKSPTYSEMYFKKTKSGWESQVVIDV